MTKSRVAVVAGNRRDHEFPMPEAHAPMMSFGGTPLLDDYYCSPMCPTSDANMLNVRLQEANETTQRHGQGAPLGRHRHHNATGKKVDMDLLAVSASTPSQLCTTLDRNTGIEEMAEKPYQCRFCRVTFAQRQGLTRHSKDRHSPKNRCDFCVEFTWSQGRRYIYRKHLQEEHPGFVSPSVGANPIRRRRVELKGQHCRKLYRPVALC